MTWENQLCDLYSSFRLTGDSHWNVLTEGQRTRPAQQPTAYTTSKHKVIQCSGCRERKSSKQARRLTKGLHEPAAHAQDSWTPSTKGDGKLVQTTAVSAVRFAPTSIVSLQFFPAAGEIFAGKVCRTKAAKLSQRDGSRGPLCCCAEPCPAGRTANRHCSTCALQRDGFRVKAPHVSSFVRICVGK